MKNIRTRLSRIHFIESQVLILILLSCLVLVSLTIKSYSASYDEVLIHEYANNNVRAYINLVFYKPFESLTDFYNLQYYGPAVWVITKIASLPLSAAFHTLDEYDAGHIVNFAVFLLGAWFVFCLGRRFASSRAALVASLLYLTQPLLWGHGVMNSKDIPFMTFFLGTVLVGVRMVEEISRPQPENTRSFRPFTGRRKYLSGLALLVTGLAFADLATNHLLSRPPIAALITHAYSAETGDFLHALFIRLAANAGTISVAAYIEKAIQIVNVAESALMMLVFLGIFTTWLFRTSVRNRWIVLAGVTAGLTISIRVLGPAAMGMVGLYALARFGRRAIKPLLAYAAVSILVTYATWPYLWTAPISRFLESLQVMANFPWPGTVRFEGGDYLPSALPWYYLPKLIGIQLTLPLLGLALAGLISILRAVIRRSTDWKIALIPVLWFFLPLAGVMLLRPNMYDNFRQFLFILPPIFFFAAAGIETILDKIGSKSFRNVLCLAMLIPGIAAGIWLHPYEYIYYNALVGWTGSIGRSYETDYWFTSLCEMGQYLNANAPNNAKIAITEEMSTTLLLRCMDKKFQLFVERVEVDTIHPDFSVIPSRYDDDQDYFRNMPIIYTSGRGNTIFSVIKKVP